MMTFLKKKSLLSVCFFIFITSLSFFTLAQTRAHAIQTTSDDAEFFSYKRFLLNTQAIEAMPATSGTGRDLKKFVKDFTDGVYLLSGKQSEKALVEFSAARKIWPEYFGTDFLIALSYEELGDVDTAARFYKSYLIKLRNFHIGHNRISAPIIQILSRGEIESYPFAEKLVEDHLAAEGIQLAGVRPAATTTNLPMYIAILVVLISAYLIIVRIVVPLFIKRKRRKMVPEGFWLCENCGTVSPNLSKVCIECQHSRKK
jgi:hypothetical protein